MAITKILSMNDCGKAFAGKYLKQAIDYILEPSKTQNGRLVQGMNCQPMRAFEQMKATKKLFGKVDKRQGYHMIISFEEGEVSPEIAFEIIGRFVEEFLGDKYEAVYAVHDNTDHVHGHIIFNSVNYLDGNKFHYKKGDWAKIIQPITNRLCEEYGLSTIDIEKGGKKANRNYQDWNDFRDGKFVWADMIKRDLDACIIQASTFEHFLELIQQKGYEVKQNKYLAVKPPGLSRFRRLKTLGENYEEERIKQRIFAEDLAFYQKQNRDDIPTVLKYRRVTFIKKAKLSGLQKKYYAKMYRSGRLKKKPYSQAWKYRDDIRKMHQYHRQYMFLADNEVHSLVDLIAVRNNLEDKKKEVGRERSRFFRERSKFKDLFRMYNALQQLLPAEESFKAGDMYFKEEHEQYMKLEQKLVDAGYSIEEVANLQAYYENGAKEERVKSNEINKRLRMANGIIKEAIEESEQVVKEKQVETKLEKDREQQPKR